MYKIYKNLFMFFSFLSRYSNDFVGKNVFNCDQNNW